MLKGVCAVIMGIAIPAMHYTGMAAVNYTPMSEKPDMTNAMDISVLANTAIVVVTFIVIGSVVLFQRRTAVPKESARPEALGKEAAGQGTF